jgi:hypothetical protein
MTRWHEENLAGLLGALPPAPEAWAQAARELPRTREELADALGRIEADEEFRRVVLRDLDGALGPVAPEDRAARAAAIRAHLDELS